MREYLELPSLEFLNECFSLSENGVLKWKNRPENHFSNPQIASMWNSKNAGKDAGRKNKKEYLQVAINGVRYMSHRIIYKMHFIEIDKLQEVDHRNGIHFDNVPSNLRLATRSKNQFNATKRIDNTSGIKGVHHHSSGGFEACVQKNKVRHSRLFKDKNSANEWCIKERAKLHGSFSNNG